jgi:hypothetical protein
MSKNEMTSDILEMSKMAKDVKSASNMVDLTNLTESLTFSIEEVAVAEMSSKCSEMSTFAKVMAVNNSAVSTHYVSGVRQINMAGNI